MCAGWQVLVHVPLVPPWLVTLAAVALVACVRAAPVGPSPAAKTRQPRHHCCLSTPSAPGHSLHMQPLHADTCADASPPPPLPFPPTPSCRWRLRSRQPARQASAPLTSWRRWPWRRRSSAGPAGWSRTACGQWTGGPLGLGAGAAWSPCWLHLCLPGSASCIGSSWFLQTGCVPCCVPLCAPVCSPCRPPPLQAGP